MRVYIEPVLLEPHLIILGAGHVGKSLARLARFTGFRVTVIDDREEFANRENIPDANEIKVTDFTRALNGTLVSTGTFIVVATRGHNHDLDAVKAALRTEASYIGLLGSRRKKALLNKALAESGFSTEAIGRIMIPVGIEIGSVTPEEIAVSIMAQIIRKRRENGVSRSSAASCSGFVQENGDLKATSAFRQ